MPGGIGHRFPASITASGKAILATLPPGAVEDRFRGKLFPRYTERSIQSLPDLLRDLDAVRETMRRDVRSHATTLATMLARTERRVELFRRDYVELRREAGLAPLLRAVGELVAAALAHFAN
mgnify:CR=1 FL=1